MNTEKKQTRRSIKNLILAPRLQLPFALYSTLATVVFVGSSLAVLAWIGNDSINLILTLTDAPAETEKIFRSIFKKSGLIITAFAVIFVLINFLISSVISHRMVGPVVQFIRHVKALTGGEYASRVNIRPKDGFYDLADELNKLAETLEHKK